MIGMDRILDIRGLELRCEKNEDGRRDDEGEGAGDSAGEGGTEGVFKAMVSLRDQSSALTGMRIGVLGRDGGSTGTEAEKGDREPPSEGSGAMPWSYTARMWVGRSASGLSSTPGSIGISSLNGGGTPGSRDTRFTL